MITHPTLYKIDSKGNTRIWYIIQDNDSYSTVDGLKDGKLKQSIFRKTSSTNVGKANERSPIEQAEFEINALYVKKTERDYHYDEDSAKNLGSIIFEPMLAQDYDKSPIPPDTYYIQPKLDGIRCIVSNEAMFTRKGKEIISCPHIFEELKQVFVDYPDYILDGELYNHSLKDDFNEIQSMITKKKLTEEDLTQISEIIEYHIYDIYVPEKTFTERHLILKDIFNKYKFKTIKFVDTNDVINHDEFKGFQEDHLINGYEGSILRNKNAPYEHKRTKNLLKVKEFTDAEFKLIQIREGIGNWSGVAKSVLCQLPDGRRFSAGIKGNRQRAKELLNEKYDYVTVKYFNLTPDGIPRFGVAIKFYEGERDY